MKKKYQQKYYEEMVGFVVLVGFIVVVVVFVVLDVVVFVVMVCVVGVVVLGVVFTLVRLLDMEKALKLDVMRKILMM